MPDRPKFVSDFVHKQPVDMKVGITSKHPKWGEGGGRQFELGDGAKKNWFSKAVIESGLEGRPANVLFYATSNRRHHI